jgi:hypothetical protein
MRCSAAEGFVIMVGFETATLRALTGFGPPFLAPRRPGFGFTAAELAASSDAAESAESLPPRAPRKKFPKNAMLVCRPAHSAPGSELADDETDGTLTPAEMANTPNLPARSHNCGTCRVTDSEESLASTRSAQAALFASARVLAGKLADIRPLNTVTGRLLRYLNHLCSISDG